HRCSRPRTWPARSPSSSLNPGMRASTPCPSARARTSRGGARPCVGARLRGARQRGPAEGRAAAGGPAQVRLRLAERGLVREPPGDRRVGPSRLLADEREVAAVLGLLPLELGEDRGRPATLCRQQADEDLVAQRRGPARPPGEPGAERPLAAGGQAEDAARARAHVLVAPDDEP